MAQRELPKRNAKELAESLRSRAKHLCGEPWEMPATIAMMREAADLLDALPAATTPAMGCHVVHVPMLGGSPDGLCACAATTLPAPAVPAPADAPPDVD